MSLFPSILQRTNKVFKKIFLNYYELIDINLLDMS